ncbi:MAG TPA: ABC transporter substrate-binding protein [Acetobacteraceae bacterium]|nr:ABC transporter substrate-binding protein [Acetobacteraceae bacterium]
MKRGWMWLGCGMLALMVGAQPAAAAVFKWANSGDAAALDPYTRDETVQLSMLQNVYEPLIGRDRNLKLQPALALSWKHVSPLVWRFHLRPGVKWQDGTAFTADDVVFSAKRFLNPNSLLLTTIPTLQSATKVNDLTIDLHTKKPDPILPQEVTQFFIMSKAWCEKHNATAPVRLALHQKNYAVDHAMGTGPYKILIREPDRRTVFVKNPLWWGKLKGNVTRAEFYNIANPSTRVAALISGQVDMIEAMPLQDIPRVEHSAGLSVLKVPSLRTIFLGMDVWRKELPSSNIKGKNPLQDVRVRRAFALAIDENAIARVVMHGLAHPTWEMWGPGVNGYNAKLDVRPAANPAEAKKLLAEAGYPHGFTLGMDCPNDRYVNDAQICTAIVSMLARVGVKVNLLAQEKTKFFAKTEGPKFNTDFYMLGWAPSTYDAESPLFALTGTRNGVSGEVNYGGYSNPTMDRLIADIGTQADETKRQAEIDKAIKLLQADVGYIPLHQQVLVWAAKKSVSVVQPADGMFALRYVTVH